jgi:shikimate dehydrogenase
LPGSRGTALLREPGLLGIVGNPVRASLSPAMHGAALRRLGLDARYLAFEIAPDQLRDVLRALRPLGFWGINVTIPYKEAVLRHLDRLDPEAAAIGAVNTVVVGPEGLAGHNTDAPGFLRALQDAGGSVRGERVLVVGAGGAARAVAHAALGGGCRSLVLANRTPARALALRRWLGRRHAGTDVLAVEAAGASFGRLAASCGVLVNTTPLGSRPADPLPLPRTALHRGQVVVDIVYRPRRTPLLEAARASGALTVDGLGMLLHQGALALRLWTGCEPPLAAMRRALAAAATAAGR